MLKQEDQVHVTFLREIEPLPFSVNHTKLESSMTQPSREERVLFYRQRMPDKFAIYDGHILLHDLRTQMKQFRAKDGSISYMCVKTASLISMSPVYLLRATLNYTCKNTYRSEPLL